MLENVIAVILAGGQGKRLWPLTAKRAKPAVPIAGKFRLIDISFSNCLHSDIRKMVVLTQFASQSLHRHINQTYPFPPWSSGFVQILAAQQTLENTNWYQGTADAVRQNLNYLDYKGVDYYLILSGDHLYRMDYRQMLSTHIAAGADVTVSVLPVSKSKARHFGVVKTDKDGRISAFYEKPQSEEILAAYRPNQEWMAAQGADRRSDHLLASMGIYLFSRKTLTEVLYSNPKSDFGKDIFPEAISKYKVVAHFFNDYWEDIGTIRAFYDSMIALTDPRPKFDFYSETWPVYTRARYLPGSRIHDCQITESIVCDAARMKQARIHKSIVGIRSMIRVGAVLDRVVLMGADYTEESSDMNSNRSNGRPDMGVGENTVIEKAIIDKNARIGRNVRILEEGRPEEAIGENFAIRDGIVIIPKSAVVPDDTVIPSR